MAEQMAVELGKPMLQKLRERSERRDILEVASECDVGFGVIGIVWPKLNDKLRSRVLEWDHDPLRAAINYVLKNKDKVALVVCLDWFSTVGWGEDWFSAMRLWKSIEEEKRIRAEKL